MAGFDDVIAKALARHENTTPEVREQVYSAARNALVGMLQKADNLTAETVSAQKQRLEIAIAKIESQFGATPDEPSDQAAYVSIDRPDSGASTPGQAPIVAVKQAPAVEVEPSVTTPVSPPVSPMPQSDNREKSRRHPFAMLLFISILLAAVGMGAWWIYNQELFSPAANRDNSVPNPPRVLTEEQFGEAGSGNRQGELITIFEPSDPTGLVADGTVTAILATDVGGKYIRLMGKSGTSTGSARVVVDPGVMETMAGNRVVFSLKIKSSVGLGHQFTINCQFRELGECGRRRFTASLHMQTYVFEATLANGPVTGNDKTGSINIVVDVSGTAKALDIYSLEMEIVPQ